jgi:Uma2 family endonuclease
MTDLTPAVPERPTRISVARYLDLVVAGALSEDDRVELLEGVIVAMPPANPPHDAAVTRCTYALIRALGDRAVVRTQCSFLASAWSLPEPDVAVVPGTLDDYDAAHPNTALLLVEVADTSLPQDRLSKSRIYANAGIPDYWIVNLREGLLEVMRDPDPATAVYRDVRTHPAGATIELAAMPGVHVAVAELIPPRR